MIEIRTKEQAYSDYLEARGRQLSPLQRMAVKEAFEYFFDCGYMNGFEVAMKDGNVFTRNVMLCAFVLIMHRNFGFGKIRAQRLIDAINQEVVNTITSDEIQRTVWQECGVWIDLDDNGLGMDE